MPRPTYPAGMVREQLDDSVLGTAPTPAWIAQYSRPDGFVVMLQVTRQPLPSTLEVGDRFVVQGHNLQVIKFRPDDFGVAWTVDGWQLLLTAQAKCCTSVATDELVRIANGLTWQ